MQSHFILARIFLAACLLTSIGPGVAGLHAQNADLIGKWESELRSSGGIGATLLLNLDGTAANIPGAMVDFRYQLDEDTLDVIFNHPGNEEESVSTVTVHFRADSMFHVDPGTGHETGFVRVGATEDGDVPILGKWSFLHYTGAQAFQIYTRAGDVHLRVPFRTDSGRYEVIGDSLTVFLDIREPWRVHFAVDGDMLTVSEPGKPPETFRRVPW